MHKSIASPFFDSQCIIQQVRLFQVRWKTAPQYGSSSCKSSITEGAVCSRHDACSARCGT